MGVGAMLRFMRAQFLPLMIAPVTLGAAAAWFDTGEFDLLLFTLALLGASALHLASNAIDDVYDYTNGVDAVSDRIFPPDAPGWKPMPRGMIDVGQGKLVSALLYLASALVGILLSLMVGWWAIAIAAPGILLSYVYTAPPLKLDYRGWGAGEASILVCFGPIPALGTYYVLTGTVSAVPALVAVPTGTLIASVLISHDMIFYDAYKEAGKNTLAVVLGRNGAAKLVAWMGVAAYALVLVLAAAGAVPAYSAAVLVALPLFVKYADFRGKERAPPEYGPRTMAAFAHSVLFTALFAAALILG